MDETIIWLGILAVSMGVQGWRRLRHRRASWPKLAQATGLTLQSSGHLTGVWRGLPVSVTQETTQSGPVTRVATQLQDLPDGVSFERPSSRAQTPLIEPGFDDAVAISQPDNLWVIAALDSPTRAQIRRLIDAGGDIRAQWVSQPIRGVLTDSVRLRELLDNTTQLASELAQVGPNLPERLVNIATQDRSPPARGRASLALLSHFPHHPLARDVAQNARDVSDNTLWALSAVTRADAAALASSPERIPDAVVPRAVALLHENPDHAHAIIQLRGRSTPEARAAVNAALDALGRTSGQLTLTDPTSESGAISLAAAGELSLSAPRDDEPTP